MRTLRHKLGPIALGVLLSVSAITGVSYATSRHGATVASTCTDVNACLDSIQNHSDAISADVARAKSLMTTTTTVPSSTTVAPTTTTASTTTTVPTGAVQPLGVPGSWTATFADEFNGTALDRTKWNTSGNWERNDGGRSNLPNGELDYKTDGANFSFANGALTIQARRETAPNGMAWTSGQIGSKQTFQYGYFEIRSKFASPKGFLNAYWTWLSSPYTETDVYEFYSDNHNQVAITQHNNTNGDCGWKQLGFDPTAGYHVYGFDSETTGTDFYIDGKHICHAGSVPNPVQLIDYMTVSNCVASSASIYRAPCADASTTHAEYSTDYIRAWKH